MRTGDVGWHLSACSPAQGPAQRTTKTPVFPPTIDTTTFARHQTGATPQLRLNGPIERLRAREPDRRATIPRVRRLGRRAGRSRWLLLGLVALVAGAVSAPASTLAAADSLLTLLAL